MPTVRGVLVFDRAGDVIAFASPDAAAGYLEVIDVLDGEYPAAYDSAGGLLAVTTTETGLVELLPTGRSDPADLTARLKLAQQRLTFASAPTDADAVIAELVTVEQPPRWTMRLGRRRLGR